MPLKLNSAGGGSVTVDVPSTASNFTLTAPARTGNIITSADTATLTQSMAATTFYGGYGPAFSATLAANQTVVAATPTKCALSSEEFDTNTCFDNVTNYRFTPTVAGYYQINAVLSVAAGVTTLLAYIYKNGAVYSQGSRADVASARFNSFATALIYMNGTTDYIELFGYTSSTIFATGTRLSGFLARPA
jgi:hypothetical protein